MISDNFFVLLCQLHYFIITLYKAKLQIFNECKNALLLNTDTLRHFFLFITKIYINFTEALLSSLRKKTNSYPLPIQHSYIHNIL